MKHLSILILPVLLAVTSCRTAVDLSGGERDRPPAGVISVDGREMELFWSEEFGTPGLEGGWSLAEGERRGGYWSPEAVEVRDGFLRIRTYYDEAAGSYIDGCASTEKKDFLYGYYSARIRMKKGAGHWGAFWIWNHPYEIDVMEKPYTGDQVHHALHWYRPAIDRDHREKAVDIRAEGLDEGWHIYSVLWLPDRYIFYVDGVKTWELDDTQVDVADVPGEIILSDEINEGWPGWLGVGNIRKNRDLPDWMDVDWIRVYGLPGTAGGEQ